MVERLQREAPHAMGWAEKYDSPSCYLVCKLALEASEAISSLQKEIDAYRAAVKGALDHRYGDWPAILEAALSNTGGHNG